MSDTTLYGLCELARELNLPESTTRYYRDVFSPYVPSVGSGRRRRYPEEALTVLRFIADAFAVGRTRDEIREALENEIVTGGLVPGARLDEVKLAGAEKVSVATRKSKG